MAPDKVSHFFVGLSIVWIIGIVSVVWAMAICILVAAGKELVWDLAMDNGTPEWLDFVATVAGGSLGYILHSL